MLQSYWLRIAPVIAMVLLFGGASQAGVLIKAGMTQEKMAKPGENYRGTIVLQNTDDRPAEAKVYQTDYNFAADGSNDFGSPGQMYRSNARWINLSQEVITIPPKGTARIDYDVKVPASQAKTLSGTYWSLVMVEPIAQESAESGAKPPDNTAQVLEVSRYGVQIVTHLGSGGDAGLSFANPRILVEDGKRLFAVDVENTGQTWLRPGVTLELYNQTGSPVGKLQGVAQRLYPGTSAKFQIDLGQIPKGKYLGLVVADGTGDNLFGANVELDIE